MCIYEVKLKYFVPYITLSIKKNKATSKKNGNKESRFEKLDLILLINENCRASGFRQHQ